MSDDYPLISLRRVYSKDETFQYLNRRYGEQELKIGQLKSEIQHLENELFETKRIKRNVTSSDGHINKKLESLQRKLLRNFYEAQRNSYVLRAIKDNVPEKNKESFLNFIRSKEEEFESNVKPNLKINT